MKLYYNLVLGFDLGRAG